MALVGVGACWRLRAAQQPLGGKRAGKVAEPRLGQVASQARAGSACAACCAGISPLVLRRRAATASCLADAC
jgi:hypothetical protein